MNDHVSSSACRIIAVAVMVALAVPRLAAGIPADLVLDPGHDVVYSPGANSAIPGYSEREINLAVAYAFLDTLNFLGGGSTILTRATNYDTASFPRRVQIAEEANACAFISIHHNGDTTPSINRTEVYYCIYDTTTYDGLLRYRDTSSVLGCKVGYKLLNALKLPKSQKQSTWPFIYCDEVYVLRRTTMASVLTEASYISNPEEAHRFHDSTRVQQEAGAIFHGWRSYKSGGGFAFVHNAYNGGPQFPVHFGVTFWANDRCGSLVKPLTRGGWACVPPEQDS